MNTAGLGSGLPPLSFAEADAGALHEVLTNELTGAFDAGDSRLLLGAQATTTEVKSALRTVALKAEPADLLFVYYAGHALLPTAAPRDDPYLLTADVEVERLNYLPDSALRMGFLLRDVFEATRASSVLILDCCHAGEFANLGQHDPPYAGSPLLSAVEQIYSRRPARQSALFACPADAAAREVRKLGHGALTHHILEGLAGAAADVDGTVTFDQLARYVCDQDLYPKPGFISQGWGVGTVVTRPGADAPAGTAAAPTLDRRVSRLTLAPCTTPMDTMVDSLEQLLDKLLITHDAKPAGRAAEEPAAPILDRLRKAVGARGVAEIAVSNSHLEVVGLSGNLPRTEAKSFVTQVIAMAKRHGESALGHIGTSTDDKRRLLGVQGQGDSRGRILVFADLPTSILDLGEPLALMLAVARETLTGHTRAEVEVALITALRERFGRVPERLYKRCLAAYNDALKAVHMVFEPVIALSEVPSTLGIYSWEALARRSPSDRSAPVDLLQTAASWSDEFLVVRDSVLAAKAIARYAAAHKEGPWGHDSPKPVSINVSTRSLLKGAYLSALSDAIDAAGLGHYGVTLEISEYDAISPHPGEAHSWKPDPHSYFQSKLTDIAKQLQVNFAIDDFGVGNASLDRIASLDVTQIKVDRAILHHTHALDELDLVVKLATDAYGTNRLPHQRVVVVEGVDSECPVALSDLFAHGVRHVQGYIAEEPASQHLQPLSQDLRKRIATMIRRPSYVG